MGARLSGNGAVVRATKSIEQPSSKTVRRSPSLRRPKAMSGSTKYTESHLNAPSKLVQDQATITDPRSRAASSARMSSRLGHGRVGRVVREEREAVSLRLGRGELTPVCDVVEIVLDLIGGDAPRPIYGAIRERPFDQEINVDTTGGRQRPSSRKGSDVPSIGT
jgi:hypothetical protein